MSEISGVQNGTGGRPRSDCEGTLMLAGVRFSVF